MDKKRISFFFVKVACLSTPMVKFARCVRCLLKLEFIALTIVLGYKTIIEEISVSFDSCVI